MSQSGKLDTRCYNLRSAIINGIKHQRNVKFVLSIFKLLTNTFIHVVVYK